MTKRFRWLIAFLGLVVVSPVSADSPAPPSSYKVVAPGGEFVFVMIAPETLEQEVQHWNEETKAKIRGIRSVYTKSGMYRNDGSTEPLWTVDWYAFGVEPTSDGVHLIRHGPWAWLTKNKTPDLNCEAVSFFADGRLLRTWSVGELVDFPLTLDRSASHYHWQKDARLTGDFEYSINTLDGNHFVLDVRNGSIISQKRSTRWFWWVVTGVMAFASVVIIIVWWRQRRIRGADSSGLAVPR